MVDPEGRLLAQIERHLAHDDPVLVECFHLWNERCGGSSGSGAGSTDWLMVLAAMAVASLVLLTLVA